jgi:hypothetical protein
VEAPYESYAQEPWTLRRRTIDGKEQIGGSRITGPNDETICKIDSILGEKTAETNARLIAAAPILLEACLVAQGILEASKLNRDGHLALEDIQAAIDSATGPQ